MNLLNKLLLWWRKRELKSVNREIKDIQYYLDNHSGVDIAMDDLAETELASARQWRATVKQMIEAAEKEKPQ